MSSEIMMFPDICRDVVSALCHDYNFKLSEDGKYLQQGKCPDCGKREMWAYADNPWSVMCSRENKCAKRLSTTDLYPEIFTNFAERFPATPDDPRATATAYLQSRGLRTEKLKKFYEQGEFSHPQLKKPIPTVRFFIAGTDCYMERLVKKAVLYDEHGDVKERKQNFVGGYGGMWWQPPDMTINDGDEVWITEAIIDTLSLYQAGIKSVAILTCLNYPQEMLSGYRNRKVYWVWALDNDHAGRSATLKHIKRMRAEGWTDIRAAQSTEKEGGKRDWNDILCQGNLGEEDRKKYLHYGALLVAPTAHEKGDMIAAFSGRTAFCFEFDNQLYWWQLKESKNEDAATGGELRQICNAYPEFLYATRNQITSETIFYLRVHAPFCRPEPLTMSSAQIYVNQEFGKKLVSVNGAVWCGNQKQLQLLLKENLRTIPKVKAIDYIGYVVEEDCYVFPTVAIHKGRVFSLNERDYFDLPHVSIRSTLQSVVVDINPARRKHTVKWLHWFWAAFHDKGMIALSFWFASLFAQQIRAAQSSFPFLEIIGEPGSGKTSLLEFLWKLLGQENQEGFDPHKFSHIANLRKIAQVSNLPTVYIEADRSEDNSKHFDWESIKPFYNGRGAQGRGVRNAGNDTQESIFRGTLVIAQNNSIQASDAVLERVIQLELVKKNHSAKSRQAVKELHKLPVEEASYFIIKATSKAKTISKNIIEKSEQIHEELMETHHVDNVRIAKNYSQIIAALDELANLYDMPENCVEYTRKKLIAMCQWRWAKNEPTGAPPALQFVGQGEDSLSLTGILYPELTGGTPSLDMLRTMANKGEPYLLMRGNGEILGYWVLESLRETRSFLLSDGTPQKIEFELSLKKYGESGQKRPQQREMQAQGDLSPLLSFITHLF